MQLIIDGDALVHKFSWPKNSIYADICMLYTQYVVNTYSDAVVVFDGYYGGASTKDETHPRRAENYRHKCLHLSADRLFLPTHQTNRPWLTLLHNTCPVQASLKNISKEMFAGMFICEWQTNSCCCRWHWCVSTVGTPCLFHQSHCWTIHHVHGDLQRDHLKLSIITWTIPLYDHCSSCMLLHCAAPVMWGNVRPWATMLGSNVLLWFEAWNPVTIVLEVLVPWDFTRQKGK